MDQYFSGNSFFNVFCNSLKMTEEVTAVEEDGLYLKHEIREWMKYRQEEKVKDTLKQLINNVKRTMRIEKNIKMKQRKKQVTLSKVRKIK